MSMTLSQLIKHTLDESYNEIPGNESTKDGAIKQEIKRLTQDYRTLKSPHRSPVDYASPVSRFAYIYKYTVAHADYIKHIIQTNPLDEVFDKSDASVCCIGGGPGSDLLGILKYMLQWNKTASLTCYLFDRERAWGDSWSEVAKVLKAKFPLYPIFQHFDVTDEETWRSYRKYLNSDIITMSYFLSEVWTLRNVAEPFFVNLFQKSKPGTLFIFVDNNDQDAVFVQWYEDMASRASLQHLSGKTLELAFSNDEEIRDLEPYFTKFGWPKRKSNLVYRVSRKP